MSHIKSLRIFSLVIAILFAIALFVGIGTRPTNVAIADTPSAVGVITTHGDLEFAINSAKDGDVILVGDIDFSPVSPDEYITNRQKTISKSITIKGADGTSTFTRGMFLLDGKKTSDSKISVTFENIIFDYEINTAELSFFDLPEDGYYSHAVEFKGNVDCVFTNCQFKNYYNSDGGVFEVRYADYTANEYLSNLYQDQSNCRLNLIFNDCVISDNCALYSGGAFYIESNNNVNLDMTNCVLSGNRSSALYSFGGGAIYADGADLTLTGCTISSNQSNCAYKEADYYVDNYGFQWMNDCTRGGGLYVLNGNLAMTNCILSKNVSTQGGGLAFTNTKADLDGCFITENRAERCELFEGDESICMPCAVGRGGAIYVDLGDNYTVSMINCTLYANSAEIAYGGVFQYFEESIADPIGVNHMRMDFCTYAFNTNDVEYDYADDSKPIWAFKPGDIWLDPNLVARGSVIIDESFAQEIFNRSAMPSADNGYNYFASPAKATADGVTVENADGAVLIKLPNSAEWNVPEEMLAEIVGDRYDGKLTAASIGNNYAKSLYMPVVDNPVVDNPVVDNPIVPNTDKNVTLYVVIGVVAFVVVCGAIIAVVLLRRKKSTEQEERTACDEESSQECNCEQDKRQQIFIAKYTYDEIERIMQNMPEVNLLTKREKEVLREMLLGKRQGEIAAHLFISTSTVKDFYKKIYDKMGVNNKDALMSKIVEVAEKL